MKFTTPVKARVGVTVLERPMHRGVDVEAAIAALTYIAAKIDTPDFHGVFKVLYGADKRHIERFAEPILGDQYVAMKTGPVPSLLYNLLKRLKDPSHNLSLDPRLVSIAEDYVAVPGYYIHVKADPDIDALSDAAIECIDAAIEEVSGLTFRERVRWSHDSAWERTPLNSRMSWEDIARTLPDADIIVEHLRNPYPD